MRKELRAFEQDKRDWELTKEREREAYRAEAVKQAAREAAEAQAVEIRRKEDQFALQLKEKDVEREGLEKKVAELSLRLKQGSQQSQGEALEATLEEMLAREFPHDDIEPVPKGITGADVVQRVKTEAGIVCGTILWEAKRTKHWTAGWLPKLRDDQRALKAELAAIVSTVLPKDAKPVSLIDGVWVADYACVGGLAHAFAPEPARSGQGKAGAGRQEREDRHAVTPTSRAPSSRIGSKVC